MNRRASLLCLTLALAAGGSGCALPVIEGVFQDKDFALFDPTPEARAQVDDEVLLVFVDVDADAEQLRTVSVDLKGLSTLPVGEEVAVGTGSRSDGRPSVDVVEGTLVTEDIDGRGQLMTVGDDAVRAVSTAGAITLDEKGSTVSGSFHVELDDGGYLEGSFASAE